MPLKDHYLPEDYEMMTDALEELLNTSYAAYECALKADFATKNTQLEKINHALTILMALSAKKQQRDEIEKGEYLRRTMF